ncbi:MAG: PAS domain S-box protein [Leptolyngbyaceae cyanobacterium SM1_4_3]|nr:PAS domain S-box protein [Leptolyngbyaceae cyanobacterium SM1_4_3]
MVDAPLPANESDRLQALHQCKILDTAGDCRFDDIVRLAAQICDVPIALVGLVDSDRQWFKANVGLALTEVARNIAFCSHTIGQSLLIVPDTLTDSRFADNPLVIGKPFIRFYAGVSLLTSEGYALGTLCVLDHVPRKLSFQQTEALQILSQQATRQIELHRSLTDLERTAIESRPIKRLQPFWQRIVFGLGAISALVIGIDAQSKFLLLAALNTGVLFSISYLFRQEMVKHRQMENELEQERDFSTAVLDTVGALVIVLNRQGEIIRFNNRCVQTTGYTFESVRLRPFWDIFLPSEEIESAKAVFSDLRAGQFPNAYENYWLTKAGERRLIAWSNTALLDTKGAIEYIIGTGIDITARRQAELALQKSETTNRALLELIPDLLIRLNRDGTYLDFLSAIDKAKFVSFDKTQGKTVYECMPPEFAQQRMHYVEQALKTGEMQVYEFQLQIAGELRTQEARIVVSGEDEVLVIVRDISDRIAIEQAKDEFISTVSHELRTPLTSLRGSLGLLLTGRLGNLTSKGHRMLEIAVNNTDRLIRLINDILDLERLESNQFTFYPQSCNIADLLRQATEVMQPMAEKAGVTLSSSSLSVNLHADPDRLLQVLTNLLSNAIKFSPPGSTVQLTTEIQLPLSRCSPFSSDPPSLLIHIQDQGRGIPASKLETIFGRFQQVDTSDARQKGGTGLGLAICRSIVKQHGGKIWVESDLGRGSSFYLSLPTAETKDRKTSSVGWSADRRSNVLLDGEQSAGGWQLILMRDQSSTHFDTLQALLEKQNCQVTVVASVKEAIARAAVSQPTAILLDLGNSETDDWELLTLLKQRQSIENIPLIIFNSPSSQLQPEILGTMGWVYESADYASLFQVLKQAAIQQGQIGRVLIVEDDLDLTKVLTAMLNCHQVQTASAQTQQEAIELCQYFIPDVLVLDLTLFEGNGFAVVDWLRQQEHLRQMPLVVYTAQELTEKERSRLRLGQTEFVTKSRGVPESLEAQIMHLLHLETGK